jgi:hypothetical protein
MSYILNIKTIKLAVIKLTIFRITRIIVFSIKDIISISIL